MQRVLKGTGLLDKMSMYRKVANLAEAEGDTPVRGQVVSRARLGNGRSTCNLSIPRSFMQFHRLTPPDSNSHRQ